ncbi:type VII secretion integral membrane protein EccD [Amycolatopsis jiangsuensis]|uniref:Type VII secretion integral membrane protein EccD n=1 Tax=Amycolatopsis jiangsuensis TaxID=1181879 RepID=A0A840IZV3_9PSEU|nr:type VII secretion integral membrane protein EccD [Amycolatopsis jiangsuensis]MBB4688391.1 type VII secretion integral membrane protein EccD [Amycolatopsis jiangsuensis]
MPTIGLVRVTVAAPARRVDLTLPERSPIAELLPGLLQHAGEQLADQGVAHGGWVLRRADGTTLDGAGTLSSHHVLDGEVLNLVPARTEWPELEYDDLVAAIAAGAERAGSAWEPAHTRRAGLVAGGAAALLALVAVLTAGPPWPGPAACALGGAALLLVAGVALARAAGDAGAGAILGAIALPFAFAGGGLLFAADRSLTGLGAPQLIAAGAALLLAAVLGLLGVVERPALFIAGATTGLLTVLGGWLATMGQIGGTGAAAIVAGAVLVFSPLLAPLSIRAARMPIPVLPRGTADLLRDEPQPPRAAVYATVVRADGLLTGLICGLVLTVVPANFLLVRDGGTAELVVTGLLTAGFTLRARLHPVLVQRIALLVAAGSGAAALTLGPLLAAGPLRAAYPVLLGLSTVIVLVGLRHSTHESSPRWGRYAELLEVAVVLAVIPVVCAVLGLYGYLRGLGG